MKKDDESHDFRCAINYPIMKVIDENKNQNNSY